MLIEVTANHIARSIPGNCTRCALAIAIAQAVPEVTGVTVLPVVVDPKHVLVIVWRQGLRTDRVVIPDPELADRLHRYDADQGELEPFTLDLDIPD